MRKIRAQWSRELGTMVIRLWRLELAIETHPALWVWKVGSDAFGTYIYAGPLSIEWLTPYGVGS